jgi:hypothetical protein
MTKKQKRWLKIIGFSLLGIILLPILLAVILLWIYQSDIIQYVKNEVRREYGMNINIKDSEIRVFSDWPNASLLLNEIDVRDTMDTFSEKPFLQAEEIRLSLNLIPLLKKNINVNSITIKKAKVQIWIDSLGQSNVSFFKQDSPKDTSTFEHESFKFKNVKLNDIHFIYMDAEKHKAIDIALSKFNVDVKRDDRKRILSLDGMCVVNRLAFNTEKGDFIKGRQIEMKNWKGEISNDFKFFNFPEAYTLIDDYKFDLGLAIETEGEGLFALKIKTKKLDRLFALSLITEKLQQKISEFQWTGLIEVNADIKTPLKRGHDPTITLSAKLDNSDFKLEDHDMLLVGIQGLVTINIPGDSLYSGDLTKATLVAEIDKATFMKWPLTGNILIDNLETPMLTANASLNIPASLLNSGQVNGPWSGTANAQLDLVLPLDYVTANNWMELAKRCDVVLKSSDIRYKVNNRKSIRLALLAHLNTKILEIRKCDISHDGQSIQASGVVYDFMRKVLNEEDHWKAKVKIKSEHIELEKWLDNIKQITEAQPAKKPNTTSTMDKQEMDDITLEVDVKKLSFDNFVATQVKGQLLIKPEIAEIKNLKLNTCKGIMQTDMVWKNSKYIKGNVKFNNAQVKEIFSTFNNFNQEVVKSEQLEGVINLNADFSLEIDSSFHIFKNSLSAVVDFSITNGRLRNFEPFEKVSKYAFKNRKLDDVEFADLKQRFHFDGTLMQIDLMEINSSAFWMYVEGEFDFDGDSDLRIQIPWKNLKKIPDDAIYEQMGEDGRQVKSLFLKAVGPKGNINISYDHSQGGKREERKEERKIEKKKNRSEKRK